jgi:predicted DNA-binding transcriptional regulator AlpA
MTEGGREGATRQETIRRTAIVTVESQQRGSISEDGRDTSRRWMTIREIADDLVVSTSTAYKWSARGWPWFPKAIRLRKGDVRVRRDWYEEWLGEQENHNGPIARATP